MQNPSCSLLWIDDDKSFLDSTGRIFQREGFEFNGVTSGKAGIGEIRKNRLKYDLVVTDLDMPSMNGIDVLREIRKINAKIPVGFASAHFGEPKWEHRLRALGMEVLRIEKPFPIVTSEDFKKLKEDMLSLLNPFKSRDLRIKNPFRLTLAEFNVLPDREIDLVFEEASRLNSEYIKEYFTNNPDKDWIVIAKKKGNIIDSGKSQDEPFQEELEALAKKYDAPVFTYSRPKVIEEVPPSPCCWSIKSRSGHNPKDFYPTVTFDFGSNKHIVCDFDTGSEASFLSYEELLKKKIIEKQRWRASSAILWSEDYTYYRLKLICELIGKIKNKKIELKFQGVRGWKTSPQVKNYKNRKGLIGRHLLTDNNIKLILDGDKKETDIL